jgi:glycerol-3-phosphate dehydrogenase
VLSVFGGKITTYRRLAEHAMEKLEQYFPGCKGAWTATAALPGSDFGPGGRAAAQGALAGRYPRIPGALMRALFRRHGAKTTELLGDAKDAADLGEDFGANLTEREIAYFVEREWACSAQDVLWRRTKAGLQMTDAQRARVAQRMGEHAPAR